MKVFYLFLIGTLYIFPAEVLAQEMSGLMFLEKTTAYHDPNGKWATLKADFHLQQIIPEKPIRQSIVALNNAAGRFTMERKVEEAITVRGIANDSCFASVDGKTPTEKQIEEYRLKCEQIKNYRDYYTYLLGLPMKLHDQGTQIDSKAVKTTFMGKDCWSLKVTYTQEVGKDIWYFYASPNTFALIGCRFFHNEADNDGEYIVFEDEVIFGAMKFPKNRAWYMNIDNKHLGTDTILSIK